MVSIKFSSAISILLLCFICIEASVHEYAGENFISKGNAFVFHGGSEGIFSPVSYQNGSLSFIR